MCINTYIFTLPASVNCEKKNNRHKDALKYYKTGHGNGQGLSFSIVGEIIDVEEGRSLHGWIATRVENKKV
jgi:hypothetical protein